MAEVPNDSSPPDWNTFTLDLFCPRCDYNVRMLTGSRCPECGLFLDWPRIVAVAEQRVESPFFEYRWRDRFTRSFFHTARMCVQPWRLWKTVPIADVPQPRALVGFLLIVGAIYVSVLTYVNVFGVVIFGILYERSVRRVTPWAIRTFFESSMLAIFDVVVHFLAAATVLGFVHIFQQTLFRHRISLRQLLRVVIFSYAALLLVKFLYALPILANYSYSTPRWLPPLATNISIDVMAFGICVASLGLGLRSYLHVDRGWTITICVFVLTLLTWITAIVVFSVAFDTWSNPIARTVGNAWPGFDELFWLCISR